MTSRTTPDATWTYTYDARNSLVEVQKDSEPVATYVYDPEGNRIYADYPDDSSITYHFDPTGQVTENPIMEAPSSGPHRNYIYLNRKLLARVDGTIESGKKYWFMTDHLGSARGMTDGDGNVVWKADYEAFEKVKGEPGELEVPRFAGKAWDEHVGLYYFDARWYDAGLGRFVGEDSHRANQSGLALNYFVYSANNPFAYVDPSGNVYLIAWSYGRTDLLPYTNEQGEVDWERFTEENSFARAADTQKQALIDAGVPEDEIDLQRIDSEEDLAETWNRWAKYDQVDQLHFYSHGYEGGAEVAGGSGDFWGTEEKLNWAESSQWTDNRYAVFYGCNIGQGDFAQDFANRQGVKTYAPDDYANFSSNQLVFVGITDGATTGSVYLLDYEIKVPAQKDGEWKWKGIVNTDGYGKAFYPQ